MLRRQLLSAKEACYELGGISLRHLWNLTQPRGPLPAVKLGRRVFYRPKDLEAFIEQMALGGATAPHDSTSKEAERPHPTAPATVTATTHTAKGGRDNG